jgi:hypothetical protein
VADGHVVPSSDFHIRSIRMILMIFFWLKNMPPAEFGWFEFGCHFPDVGSCRSQTGLLSRGFHRFRFHWWIFWDLKWRWYQFYQWM